MPIGTSDKPPQVSLWDNSRKSTKHTAFFHKFDARQYTCYASWLRVEIVELITVRRKAVLFSFEIRFVDSCCGMFCFVIAHCHSPHSTAFPFLPASHPKIHSVSRTYICVGHFLFVLTFDPQGRWQLSCGGWCQTVTPGRHCVIIPKSCFAMTACNVADHLRSSSCWSEFVYAGKCWFVGEPAQS